MPTMPTISTNMPIDQLIDAINHASAQNDRWLFIASLVVLLASYAYLFRWLTGRFEKMNEKLSEVLERNSAALNGSISASQQVVTEINYCRMRANIGPNQQPGK